jgi:outer membrane protein assembly factor BamD
MKIINKFILATMVLAILFSGCTKEVDEYNKPAMYWYTKMMESISYADLESADNHYSSLQSEHVGSPLLPEATLILALAHMHYEEFILAEHFLDEYTRRYATSNQKEEADFLKIKAKYMSLPNSRRDQALVTSGIKAGENFKKDYPNSMYLAFVDTMLIQLYLGEAVLNETIANLYGRLGKPKAAKHYKNSNPQPWIVWDDVNRAESSWFRAMFEGDGTQSWYGNYVPDSVSVVSRNSNKEVKKPLVKVHKKEESNEAK